MRVIVKINAEGKLEVFSSLKGFFAKYPEFEAQKSNIEHYLTRKKEAFETATFKLIRIIVE